MKKLLIISLIISLLFSVISAESCTIFTIKTENTVYFGNNEDYIYDNTFISFIPGNGSTYGHVNLGFHNNNGFIGDNSAQGGLNTEGLAFDANALPPLPLNSHKNEKIPIPSGEPLENILMYCKNVPEVVNWFLEHDFNIPEIPAQVHFADASGNATVVSVYNGEWTFTFINKEGYLISTNYNLANISNGEYPSWRYNNTELLIQQQDKNNITEQSLVNILQSTHQTGEAHTVYSYLINLQSLDLKLFYEADFSKDINFNLLSELLKGEHTYDLGELFAETQETNTINGYDVMSLVLISTIPIVKKKIQKETKK